MASFAFVARDAAGRIQRGVNEAASPAALVNSLRERGWSIVDVRARTEQSASASDQFKNLSPLRHLPPASIDVEVGFYQLAVMLRGGLTLLTSLRAVAEQARRPKMATVWNEVASRVQAGSSFADSMASHRCFPQISIQLVKVGEQTGSLESVVVRAADIMEKRRQLRNSMLTAMSYPAVVFFAAIGVTAFMILSVIPKLQVFLSALGRKLPAMTQFLVDLSSAAQMYYGYVVIAVLALTGGGVALYFWPPGRHWLDRSALRIPVLGPLFRLAGTATFSRGLGILIRSGITLLEALRTAEQLHRNWFLREQVASAREAVMQGGNLAEPLKTKYAFMPMLAAMVAVGEQTGTLDEVLEEVARFHESQLQAAIRRFSVIIEPIIIVIVGSIVGFVYISFFMALFSAAGSS